MRNIVLPSLCCYDNYKISAVAPNCLCVCHFLYTWYDSMKALKALGRNKISTKDERLHASVRYR